MKIPINEIKVPYGRLQNPAAVAAYAQRLRSGEQAPPILLCKLKVGRFKYHLEDGHHRLAAARLAGHKEIEARVMPGFIEFYHHRLGGLCHRIVEE
jgi:ParB-like chromosome segregation protein Spo0J